MIIPIHGCTNVRKTDAISSRLQRAERCASAGLKLKRILVMQLMFNINTAMSIEELWTGLEASQQA